MQSLPTFLCPVPCLCVLCARCCAWRYRNMNGAPDPIGTLHRVSEWINRVTGDLDGSEGEPPFCASCLYILWLSTCHAMPCPATPRYATPDLGFEVGLSLVHVVSLHNCTCSLQTDWYDIRPVHAQQTIRRTRRWKGRKFLTRLEQGRKRQSTTPTVEVKDAQVGLSILHYIDAGAHSTYRLKDKGILWCKPHANNVQSKGKHL